MTQCCWYEWDEGSNGVMHYATSVCQLCNFYYSNLTYMDCLPPTTTSVRTLPPGLLNGNLTFSPSGNNTKPSTGLLNGRIPTGAAGKLSNASPITTFNPPASGNTSNSTNNTTTTAMKATRGVYSPTGGCIPGGSTCVPCDIGLARIGANCIPSGDWHPTNGLPPLSTLQQQQPTPPPSTNTLPPSAELLNKAPTDHTERCFAIVKGGGPVCKPSGTANTGGPVTTVLCPDGSTPDANGKCPTSPNTTTTTNQQATPTPTTIQHHHKGSNVSGGINKR